MKTLKEQKQNTGNGICEVLLDYFEYKVVRRAVLKLIKIKREKLIDGEEYFKLHKDNLMTMEEIEEYNNDIYSDIFDIERIMGKFD